MHTLSKTIAVSLFTLSCTAFANSMHGISLGEKGVELSVSGTAKLEIPNNEAEMEWTAHAQEKTLQEANKKVTEALNKGISQIKTLGSDLTLKTLRPSSYPVYGEQQKDKAPKIVAWRVTQSIEVKTGNVEQVAKVIEMVSGELQLNNLAFSVSDEIKTQYQEKLLKDAIGNATQKAVWVAQAIGCEASNVQLSNIRISGSTPIRPLYAAMRASNKMTDSSYASSAPIIEEGSSELSLTVDASVLIKKD